ncbi:MAG: AAA family ATPase [Verrucomicrobia bacterium]|nr:AAA family ATPase [Verrucomicrobiota bacterium]
MIQRIAIEQFKSLKHVDLKLGSLNLLIGTNGSGKSNLLDVLRVLRGIAAGYPLKELFEGNGRTASGDAGLGIRGGLDLAQSRGQNSEEDQRLKPDIGLRVDLENRLGLLRYEIEFDSTGAVNSENLWQAGREVFKYADREGYFLQAGSNTLSAIYPNAYLGSQIILAFRSGLVDIHHQELVQAWRTQLLRTQLLEPDPRVLRQYGSTTKEPRMGDHGENFASLVRDICSDPARKEGYLGWLKELRPLEIEDVMTRNGALGEPLFFVREGTRELPSAVLSDGTLRFAALAAAFFQTDMPEVLTIDEIENGIHPGRLRLLLQLLRQRAGQTQTQVFAATHSPLLLDWLTEEEWQTTFFFHRDPSTGFSSITPLVDLPGFRSAAKQGRIGQLFAEGWMDFAL